MSNIDDKLLEILRQFSDDEDDSFNRSIQGAAIPYKLKAIAAIKQVFVDEGYVKAGEWAWVGKGTPPMTGREWYDRFDKEAGEINASKMKKDIEALEKSGVSKLEATLVSFATWVDKTAKKASGVDER